MNNHHVSQKQSHHTDYAIASAHGDHHGVYPPYFDAIVAGGIGGSAADCLMHSVDTVKTRLQGQPLNRSTVKYHNMVQAYKLIFKEEGILRGLYAGVTPAMLGSIPGTALYFGIYEFTKRNLTANNIPEIVSHLAAGSLGDLAASIVYVPSEVLKTRMQLQGKYNNPHFVSGYNYKGTWHAARTIVKYDGFGALFHGFRATILRDVPYSALQFAFYEQFKKFAKNNYVNPGEQLPVGMDLLTGSLAGGIAGAVTTPLDVVKTLLQTQPTEKGKKKDILATTTNTTTVKHYSGIVDGLIWNYKNQGFAGLFRGIGPRVFWTSLQSAIMFVIYEQVLHLEEDLRRTDDWPPSRLATRMVSL
ncbi:unnamed protein product [Mucor circinelloides]